MQARTMRDVFDNELASREQPDRRGGVMVAPDTAQEIGRRLDHLRVAVGDLHDHVELL